MNQQRISIPYEHEDELIHRREHPFCDDLRCPCHEDRESIEQMQAWLTEGLLSVEDADRIYRGQTLA